jgi:23S rRNA pseudouridine1911/1915/1917 synthase
MNAPPTRPPDRNYPDRIEHTYTFTIAHGQTPQRMDAYLAEVIPNATRTKVQHAIESGAVLLNGHPTKASRKVQPHDVIVVRVMKLPPLELVPEELPLDILYEDDTVLVVNKAAGMVTHPGFGNRYGTLVNAVLWHLGAREALPLNALHALSGTDDDDADDADEESEDGHDLTDHHSTTLHEPLNEGALYASDAVRPGIVHRLDKDTSGILVVSKDVNAHPRLAEQFAKRTAKREYWALVWGSVKDDAGMIEGDIGRSPRDRKLFAVVNKGGKHAATDYEVVERFEYCTLLALRLRTGRTHQIRVHCAHRHHPLVGDPQYGGNTVVYGGHNSAFRRKAEECLHILQRQALHARMLGFRHPKSGNWMEFFSPLPNDMEKVLALLRA